MVDILPDEPTKLKWLLARLVAFQAGSSFYLTLKKWVFLSRHDLAHGALTNSVLSQRALYSSSQLVRRKPTGFTEILKPKDTTVR